MCVCVGSRGLGYTEGWCWDWFGDGFGDGLSCVGAGRGWWEGGVGWGWVGEWVRGGAGLV